MSAHGNARRDKKILRPDFRPDLLAFYRCIMVSWRSAVYRRVSQRERPSSKVLTTFGFGFVKGRGLESEKRTKCSSS
jgi:hypothetical protein